MATTPTRTTYSSRMMTDDSRQRTAEEEEERVRQQQKKEERREEDRSSSEQEDDPAGSCRRLDFYRHRRAARRVLPRRSPARCPLSLTGRHRPYTTRDDEEEAAPPLIISLFSQQQRTHRPPSLLLLLPPPPSCASVEGTTQTFPCQLPPRPPTQQRRIGSGHAAGCCMHNKAQKNSRRPQTPTTTPDAPPSAGHRPILTPTPPMTRCSTLSAWSHPQRRWRMTAPEGPCDGGRRTANRRQQRVGPEAREASKVSERRSSRVVVLWRCNRRNRC